MSGAALAKSTALLPLLHEAFKERPTIDLVRALAVLGDSEIVPQLIELLDQTESAMQPLSSTPLATSVGPKHVRNFGNERLESTRRMFASRCEPSLVVPRKRTKISIESSPKIQTGT